LVTQEEDLFLHTCKNVFHHLLRIA
jgi:hypothetical protein